MKDMLIKLLTTYGATGREDKIRGVILDYVKPYVDETHIDAMGNLVAVRHGTGKRVMLAAHMDQIGFIVTDIDEKGFLRVSNVGGIIKTNSLNRHVIFENGVSGLVSCEVRDHDVKENSMMKLFVDIGAQSREEAQQKVRRGDVCVYAPDVFEMGGRLSGPAMDNRAGCALVIEALRLLKDTPHEILAVFTTQEEVGLRGAKAAAYALNPDLGIALDVTPCGDTPKAAPYDVELGKGIAVKIMDGSVICTPRVVSAMERAANTTGVSSQREVLMYGSTDAGVIQTTRGGVPSGVLSVPCRYVHSAAETIDLSDLEGGARLLAALLADKEL